MRAGGAGVNRTTGSGVKQKLIRRESHEEGWSGRLAWHGGFRADAAHARRGRLRPYRAGVLHHLQYRWQGPRVRLRRARGVRDAPRRCARPPVRRLGAVRMADAGRAGLRRPARAGAVRCRRRDGALRARSRLPRGHVLRPAARAGQGRRPRRHRPRRQRRPHQVRRRDPRAPAVRDGAGAGAAGGVHAIRCPVARRAAADAAGRPPLARSSRFRCPARCGTTPDSATPPRCARQPRRTGAHY